MTHPPSAISPVAHDSKKKRMPNPKCRNEYQRKMQRIYRRAEADERRQLRHTVAMLESYASLSRTMQMVSWYDTAIGLKDEVDRATSENTNLRSQLADQRALAEALSAFVSTPGSPLPEDRTARRMSLTWMTQRLFANTQCVLHAYAFPSCGAMADVEHRDGATVMRHQRLLPVCVEIVADAYAHAFVTKPHPGCSSTELDTELLAGSGIVHRRWDFGLGCDAFVHRHFRERGQSLLVSTSVDSGSCVAGWAIARITGPNTTLVQEFWTVRHTATEVAQSFLAARCAFVDALIL
ncbi:hypothetical protein ACHHYP_17352 [Achlya hypogyna]|uniref:Uncharacterized protein n=1 Tax=Achlya hypogyna TaxID=1202772 RepID=A0A1V9Y4M3_ACHHY|nr:hypothetical protein ACHHYP_17352 [Achlya hypogyna]